MKVTIDSIEVKISTEEDFNVGALIALINPCSKKVRCMCSADVEVKFSKEEMEELKKQFQEKIQDGKFLEEMEIEPEQ